MPHRCYITDHACIHYMKDRKKPRRKWRTWMKKNDDVKNWNDKWIMIGCFVWMNNDWMFCMNE
jgi:hypothetical protein